MLKGIILQKKKIEHYNKTLMILKIFSQFFFCIVQSQAKFKKMLQIRYHMRSIFKIYVLFLKILEIVFKHRLLFREIKFKFMMLKNQYILFCTQNLKIYLTKFFLDAKIYFFQFLVTKIMRQIPFINY